MLDLLEIVKSSAHNMFKTCLYVARIGRPDILWSVNKLARAVTKWTRACDKRSARLISSIHHPSEFKQYCHVGNTAEQCRLGLFQDSDFLEILKTQNRPQEDFVHIWKSYISANMLEVQETDICLTQFNGS